MFWCVLQVRSLQLAQSARLQEEARARAKDEQKQAPKLSRAQLLGRPPQPEQPRQQQQQQLPARLGRQAVLGAGGVLKRDLTLQEPVQGEASGQGK